MVLTSAAGIDPLLELIDEEAAELGVSRSVCSTVSWTLDDDQSPGPLSRAAWSGSPPVPRRPARGLPRGARGEVLVYEVTDCQPVGWTWDLWILPDMEAAYEQLPWIGTARPVDHRPCLERRARVRP